MSFDLNARIEVADFYKLSIVDAKRTAYPLGRFFRLQEADIESAVQEAYVFICEKWGSFREKDNDARLGSLCLTVKNKILSVHRDRARQMRRFRHFDQLPDLIDESTSLEEDHVRRIMARERLRQVQQALTRLAVDHQEVLGLLLTAADQGPERFRNIAEVMGRSETAIRSLSYRAARALKREMTECVNEAERRLADDEKS